MRIVLVIASGLLAASCNADADRASEQAPASDVASADDVTSGLDEAEVPVRQPVTSSTFVTFVGNSNLFEIEAGKLAMKNAQSAETREFAKMMVDDHTASTSDLKAAAEKSEITVAFPTRLNAEQQSLLDRLARADRADFDRQYMNQQIEGHRNALKVYQEYQMAAEEGALLAFSQKMLPVIQAHYDRLEKDTAASSRSLSLPVKQ